MALQVRDERMQVQAQNNQQSETGFWAKCKTVARWTGVAAIVGGASYLLSGPVNTAANVVNTVTGFFRKNPAEAAIEMGQNLALTGERVSIQAIQSLERNVRLSADTAKTISKDLTERVCSSYDKTIVAAASEVKASRQLVAIALGSGIALASVFVLSYTSCADNDSVCNAGRPVAFLVAMAGSVTLVAKNLFIRFRQQEIAPNRVSSMSLIEVTNLAILPSPVGSLPPGCSPLMNAAFKGDIGTLLYLQSCGINLNQRDENGRTALHFAAASGQQQAFEWLWYFGADLQSIDYDHRLPPIHHINPCHAEFREQVSRLQKSCNRFSFEEPVYDFYPPENLVFKGGGPKGIAYVGIQQCLEERGYFRFVKRIAGTSAGAINAALMGLGYNAKEMQRILGQTDLKNFLDHPYQSEREILSAAATIAQKGGDTTWNETIETIDKAIHWWSSEGPAGRPADLFKEMYQSGGLCKGEKILQWIEDLIATKAAEICQGRKEDYLHLTLGELKKLIQEGKPFKHLYLYATKISEPIEVICMSTEDDIWKDVPIADAVRASMSIPIVFAPYTLRVKDTDGALHPAPEFGEFFDGGLLKNLPIETFDFERYRSANVPSCESRTNWQTLAFNLVDPISDAPSSSNHPNLMGSALKAVSVFAAGEEILLRTNRNHQIRIIEIDNCGIGLVTGFFASKQEKLNLIHSGYFSGREFEKRQKALAERYAQHDPRKLLTINLDGKEPASIMGWVEEPDDDRKELIFDEERKYSSPPVQQMVSFEQKAQVVSTSTATVSERPDGSLSQVVDTRKVIELRQRLTMTVPKKQNRGLGQPLVSSQPQKLTREEFNRRNKEDDEQIEAIRLKILNMSKQHKQI